MNGSLELEEADKKPFLMCGVCMHKTALYLKFEGKEIKYLVNLKAKFEEMNINDEDKNFTREINILEEIIKQIKNHSKKNTQWG